MKTGVRKKQINKRAQSSKKNKLRMKIKERIINKTLQQYLFSHNS